MTLTVRTGERVAVVGASGAGKTTLLRVANGGVAPTRGAVRVLGAAPGELRGAARRRLLSRVGTVHQHLELVRSLRVVHNVNAGRLGNWSTGRAAWSLLRPQGVDDVVAALAQVGLADRVFDRTDRLSGGQQQRVAIVRALAVRPRVLLLDEITSALDPELVGEVLAVVREVAAQGMTILMATHEMGFARQVADTVAFLDQGVVLESGPPERVLGDPVEARTRQFLARVIDAGRL